MKEPISSSSQSQSQILYSSVTNGHICNGSQKQAIFSGSTTPRATLKSPRQYKGKSRSSSKMSNGKSNHHDPASVECDGDGDAGIGLDNGLDFDLDKPSRNPVLAEFEERFEDTSLWNAFFTYISYAMFGLLGHIHDLLRFFGIEGNRSPSESKDTRNFVPLFNSYESFFIRNHYRRLRDCLNRPVGGVPGAEFNLCERVTPDYNWTFKLTGKLIHAINMGSYNYLGFSAADGPCADQAQESIRQQGVGVAASRSEFGFPKVQQELEKIVALFVGHEDALVFQMGFATNALNLPAILNKDCCVISDELNHASLVLGMRLSGAQVKIFRHNDMRALERRLRESITEGNPRTHRPYKKVLIVVEGVNSMQGTIIKLPEVIRLKKKYHAYLYMDEAHSIGALGPHGRGVVDYYGVNPRDVDILMGTFTKSFGSAGGYIAGSKKFISYLRARSHSTIYGCGMSPPIAQQIIASMRIMMGDDCPGEGDRRIAQLAWNARYFRRRLHEKGYLLYGNKDSPVVPLLLYMPSKISLFSNEMLRRGIGVVIAGFPATTLITGRARFCLSSCHTKRMLDKVLDAIEETNKIIFLKYASLPSPKISERDANFSRAYLTPYFEANPDLTPRDPLPILSTNAPEHDSGDNLQDSGIEQNGLGLAFHQIKPRIHPLHPAYFRNSFEANVPFSNGKVHKVSEFPDVPELHDAPLEEFADGQEGLAMNHHGPTMEDRVHGQVNGESESDSESSAEIPTALTQSESETEPDSSGEHKGSTS